jgi:hypothetical protein
LGFGPISVLGPGLSSNQVFKHWAFGQSGF